MANYKDLCLKVEIDLSTIFNNAQRPVKKPEKTEQSKNDRQK